MYIDVYSIITAGSLVTAVLAICGFIWIIQKWFLKQSRSTKDNHQEIEDLHRLHISDTQAIQKELCILSQAMLATLDGLKQLHCNGNVTKAYEKLETHINNQAHDQT